MANSILASDGTERDKEAKSLQKSVRICICYHKDSPIIKNEILCPIHAGKALSNIDLGILGDNTGDNISEKNPYFCELTVIYWLWKNDKSDIKGLFHYRRFLNLRTYDTKFYKFSKNFTTKYGLLSSRINELFDKYDIILPHCSFVEEETTYKNYSDKHCQSDMDKALEIIKIKYPKMYDMAIQVIKNKKAIYIANILIAKKELFDEYAAWLFDILFELEKQIQPEVLKRDDYQKRAYGFLSERLTLIFINHKIKEGIKAANAPLLTIEPKFTKYINYKFNHVIRNRILIKLGIKKEKYKLKYRKIEEGKLL